MRMYYISVTDDSVVVNLYDDLTIDDSEKFQISDEAAQTIIKSGDHGLWLYENGNIIENTSYILNKYKDRKRLQIDKDRDVERFAPVTVHGRLWDADQKSVELLTQSILLSVIGLPSPTEWKDADNDIMLIESASQLTEIAGAISVQTEVAYKRSWDRKIALETATTLEEVDAV